MQTIKQVESQAGMDELTKEQLESPDVSTSEGETESDNKPTRVVGPEEIHLLADVSTTSEDVHFMNRRRNYSSSSDTEDYSDNEDQLLDTSGHRRSSRMPSMYDDLNDSQIACLNFAMEHRIFIKALLGLLAERDKKATEIGMNDPTIIKSGPLKKASHLVSGVWYVKFVEVRRGMFSYYEDAASGDKTLGGGGLLRKNVPLDYNSCSCRAVKIHRKGLNITTAGAIFELKAGGTSRLWLAKSREERHAWIQAINDAMVGGSVTRGGGDVAKEQHRGLLGGVNSKSPFKHDLKKYLRVKGSLNRSKTKQEYMTTLRELLGQSLDIPVQWIIEQADAPTGGSGGVFHEETIAGGVEQLWKDLQRDTIRINNELLQGDSGHAPEKIIGALTRIIVATSRSSSAKRAISEAKAFAYARDVLLSTNRTRSGGDSYFSIDTLCSNPSLIITVPSSREAEPLSISVALDESEGASGYSVNDKTGWVRTRNRLQMSWRRRFFVLSEGTLSLYRHATPRPHGLRGQMVVTGATISVDRSKENPANFIVSIVTKDGLKDRYMHFKNEDKLLAWTYALECTAKGSSSIVTAAAGTMSVFRLRQSPRESTKQPEPKPTDSDIVVMSMKNHVARLGLTGDGLEERIERLSAKASSQVKISVHAATEYKICTTDPQGDDSDTWAVISSTFLQTFNISGDRIVRGEEIVRVHVSECTELATEDDLAEEDKALSPTANRRALGRMVLVRNRVES